MRSYLVREDHQGEDLNGDGDTGDSVVHVHNLQTGETETYSVDLSSDELPGYRLKPANGVVWAPAFSGWPGA